MKTLLHVTLSASGTPSEVRSRIADQVQATAEAPEQAAVMASARTFIDKAVAGVSEDENISVKGTISIVVLDVPATVTVKQQAERDAHAAALRVKEAELALAKSDLETARAALAAATTDTPAEA